MKTLERLRGKPKEVEITRPTFASIGIIGANGQTGRLYTEALSRAFPDMPITGIVRQIDRQPNPFSNITFSDSITDVLRQDNRPEALILATANPNKTTLEAIAAGLGDKPLTLILPQNGIGIAEEAQQILGPNVTLIRASLFSAVSRNDDNGIKYNPDKLRISLSLVPNEPGAVFEAEKDATLRKTEALFARAGFKTEVFTDYKNMEWTKLLLNSVGSTGAVTGFTPEEIFNDPDLYAMEMDAIAGRLKDLKAAGIRYETIPWAGAGYLPLIDKPGIRNVRNSRSVSTFVSRFIASARENKPSGAWLNIQAGKPTEIAYYHQPFIDLAKQNGSSAPLDGAILKISQAHASGKIDLISLTATERKQLLLKTYREIVKEGSKRPKPKTERVVEIVAAKLGIKRPDISKTVGDFLLENVHTSIHGKDNLDKAKKHLEEDGSLLIVFDHFAKLDGIIYGKTFQKYLATLKKLGVVTSYRHTDPQRGILNQIQADLIEDWGEVYGLSVFRVVQARDMQDYENSDQINARAAKNAIRFLRKDGNALGLAAEGSRSKTNRLLRAEDGLETILRLGGKKVLVLPLAARHSTVRPINTRTDVTAGEMFNYQDLLEDQTKYLEYYEPIWRSMGLTDPDHMPTITISDCAMARLAGYLPYKNQGVYTQLVKIRRQFSPKIT